jgi:LacI family transcriptional regulator
MNRRSTPKRRILVASSIASSSCLRGVARYARRQNWHLVTDMMYTGAFPRGWKGDGIVALIAYQPELIQHIQSTGAPCVAISVSDDFLPFPSIGGDNARIGRMAADHLLERAYRSFAWAPFISDRINHERLRGFETRLSEHGCWCLSLPPAHRRIASFWHDDWKEYRRNLTARLKQLPRPTAIFAANDCVAAEIIDACGDLGVAVPEEIAVIGVGNDETLCETVPIPLSSVEIDFEEMAYRAAATLDGIMGGTSVPEVTMVRPKGVITRISTDICAVSNPHVAHALNYIAEHFPDSMLSVANVAEAVGVSRRHLERSFRNETGCTVYEYIVRRRMQEASRLLKTHPRAKIAAIAELVGLDGAGSFFRAFRRFFGESPKTHRKGAERSNEVSVPRGEPERESA